MNDDSPSIVVPTELERTDGFLDLAVLAATVLAVWYLALGLDLPIVGVVHIPLPLLAILVLPVAVWTLTGEPAADIPYLGAVATGLRSKLGWRRAHEWVLVALHYWHLVEWPIWKARCRAFLKSSRQRIIRWQAHLSARTQSSRSRGHSWASRIRSNWSGRLVR